MEYKNKGQINLSESSMAEMYGGSPSAGTDFFYDIAYILAYGYASLIGYMGSHAMTYGIAFK